MSETQKADPSVRRLAVAILVCGTIVGVVLIALFQRLRPELEAWVEQDLHTRFTLVMAGMTVLMSGSLLGLAVYLWRLGGRIARAERYPPPGMRVAHDTPIVTGDAAHRRGRLIRLCAVVLGVMSVSLAFLLWNLVRVLPELR